MKRREKKKKAVGQPLRSAQISNEREEREKHVDVSAAVLDAVSKSQQLHEKRRQRQQVATCGAAVPQLNDDVTQRSSATNPRFPEGSLGVNRPEEGSATARDERFSTDDSSCMLSSTRSISSRITTDCSVTPFLESDPTDVASNSSIVIT